MRRRKLVARGSEMTMRHFANALPRKNRDRRAVALRKTMKKSDPDDGGDAGALMTAVGERPIEAVWFSPWEFAASSRIVFALS
jgi:hypothetical protein